MLCVGGSNLVAFVEVVLILLHVDKRNWYLSVWNFFSFQLYAKLSYKLLGKKLKPFAEFSVIP